VKPSQPVSKKHLGSWWRPFVESGLMVPGQSEVNAQVRPEHREFSRAVRAMSRARIFAAPSISSFVDYLNDNLTGSETSSLNGTYYFGRMDHAELERLYSKICSASWIKAFLSAKNSNWERDHADPAQPRYFTSLEVFRAAQRLVAAAVEEEAPLTLDRLPALCDDIRPDVFSAAMRGILRYLLLFTALRAEDMEPIAGLWPGVAERVASKPLPPPQPAQVPEPFLGTFLMDDMVAILAASAAEPLRVRSGDMQIFEADHKNLVAALGSMPEWIDKAFHIDADYRIRAAIDALLSLRFMERSGKPGSAFRFVVTETGSAWLTLGAKDRLKFLFDEIRAPAQRIALLPGFTSYGTHSGVKKITPAILATYAALPVGAFYRLGEFLAYQARSRDDLDEMMSDDRNFSLLASRSWGSSPNDEAEVAWQSLLSGFLKLRLVPLGGVQLGVEPGTNFICFAVSEIGRYLLGAAKDFDLPAGEDARILIQPNFDVVFLAPSPRLEVELSRFCERKGRHIGTLFRITRSSILAAAASGMKPEQVLEVLRQYSPAELPPNVVSEIGGWFRRFREVALRPAVVVHCPDEQTATTVMAALGKLAIRLTPTVLELPDSKIPPATAKKLREAGIFVRTK
ncbi:MAG: helicase-associated domain-containing protein, partial [Terriglobia bacterium]